MRDRKRQRENRRKKEEMPDMRRNTGVLDPTPYLAVLNIRKKETYTQTRKELAVNG